jgi:hypothetical protein
MSERTIQRFVSNYIAVYRRNKKTYSILSYDHQKRYWSRSLLDPDTLITIGPNSFTPANVKIAIDDSNTFVDCIATGKYLKYDIITVPIVEKKRNSPNKFPYGIYAGEFKCTDLTTINVHTGNLWTLIPLPKTHIVETMPRRIAWIIAEDAARNNDDCPITLGPISPITASVTSCYHVFSTDALNEWLQKKNTCPVCKKVATAVRCFTD